MCVLTFPTKTTTTLTVMITTSTVLRTLTMKWRVGDSEDDDNNIFGDIDMFHGIQLNSKSVM